ncbi:D-xylose ABC transporter ATP-binding protein [candidate division KSB3 bacterium]|uniref:D-xylose ABC transporter ATP-binding protein n=1 Tax=candidate division KSB3 bacterium TaxID=2044937 RepID=A0A2G6E5M0_9BACT|nr:MAG: D-xylose ABC transporter ATP-binding protein [candidate division KSB3 bacterium]PIE29899.1 MAG: D-xylose ABC transporter ATP-binding protein [candidate division KSB3 bacterium]
MNKVKLRVSGIEKSFPGVKALSNVNFSVKEGSVHVLCGENGAGKSTLMKIINGVYQPDKGEIYIDGTQVTIKDSRQAGAYGISMIFQELNVVPEMTVEESLFLGALPTTAFKRVDWKAIRSKTLALLEEEALPYSPTAQLKNLSVSDIQMLEIVKAISRNSSIIIMDEPTSAISYKEVDRLFDKIATLKKRKTSIIYISHKMDEIFRIADEISVLRDGAVVDTRAKEDIDIDTVIALMVGRKLDNSYPKKHLTRGRTLLEVRNFSRKGFFDDVEFNVHQGEIVGFAGLMGAGRSEIVRALFGLDQHDSGELYIDGRLVELNNVRNSIEAGMVMLSEDRRRYGIIPVRSVRENVSLASLKKFFYTGTLHARVENRLVDDICRKMMVKTPGYDTTVEALSGGNQQKIVLAKWTVCDPKILILDEPTRGIDVGAKYEIYKLMTALAEEGKGLVMISSELPELLGMCDRIYVVAKGRIAGELRRKDFCQEAIMRLATGVEKKEAAA